MQISSIIAITVLALMGAGFSSAQNSISDKAISSGYNTPAGMQERSFQELALDMILSRNQSQFLDGYIDPSEYIIGPGDRFVISFVSEDQGNITSVVDANGNIFIKSVGLIAPGYVSLKDAIAAISDAVGKNYRGLDFTVQLTDFRFARINVIGEVQKPGTYYAPATWRVSEVIKLAGGLTNNASMRNIYLSGFDRDRQVDLFRYRRVGDNRANPLVSGGNTITIPAMGISGDFISISGAVAQPGIFEALADDKLTDCIAYGGGIKGPDGEFEAVIARGGGADSQIIDLGQPGAKDLMIQAGENILIRGKSGRKHFGSVTIVGEVERPGKYSLKKEKTTLSELMDVCGGITPKGCAERVEAYRLSLLNTGFDAYTKALFNDESDGQNDTDRSRLLISHNARGNKNFLDLPVIDGDSVFVPTSTGMVLVTGAVASPGLVKFDWNKRAEYYIEMAGGFGFDADRSGVVIINPVSGGRIGASEAGSLFDGETIFVPRKENQAKK